MIRGVRKLKEEEDENTRNESDDERKVRLSRE